MRLYARKLKTFNVSTSQLLKSLDFGLLVEHGLDPATAYSMMTMMIANGIMNPNMSHPLVNGGLIAGVVNSSHQQAKSA